ncbi:hypothetical protein OAT42_06270, partial [Alphaproteobacteria bacterium]|nr:hypothetical protein [Alphaproteobacteria bacterium]
NLKKKKVNYKRIRSDFNKSYNIYLEKLNNLKKIDDKLPKSLNTFLIATQNTIGLRQQQKIPRDVALYLASCGSSHRDLSLYF